MLGFEMKIQNEIDLVELVSETEASIKKNVDKEYGLFILERGVYLPRSSELGLYSYNYSPHIKKQFDKFNKMLCDEDFNSLNYVDFVGGPFNEEYNSKYWAREISSELRMRKPKNLIFYMRQEPVIIAARMLISIPDFRKFGYNKAVKKMV